ncbi:hypothetical protein [Nocardia sp. NPDC005998]|uniref:hypothetical protein n=1 Tax=Nocardia sp. NPDC005998 TaxID=3156894 RepID=UPI0033ABB3C4
MSLRITLAAPRPGHTVRTAGETCGVSVEPTRRPDGEFGDRAHLATVALAQDADGIGHLLDLPDCRVPDRTDAF